MEKRIFCVLCFVLVVGIVMGAGDNWGKINTRDNKTGDVNVSQNFIDSESSDNITLTDDVNEKNTTKDGTYFTLEFYIAMGFVLLFLLILGFFVWLWLRGPKNKWEK